MTQLTHEQVDALRASMMSNPYRLRHSEVTTILALLDEREQLKAENHFVHELCGRNVYRAEKAEAAIRNLREEHELRMEQVLSLNKRACDQLESAEAALSKSKVELINAARAAAFERSSNLLRWLLNYRTSPETWDEESEDRVFRAFREAIVEARTADTDQARTQREKINEQLLRLVRKDRDAAEAALRKSEERVEWLRVALQGLIPEGWDDSTMDHMPGIAVAREVLARTTSKRPERN